MAQIEVRDIAVLATMALLFAFTIQLMAVNRNRRRLENRLADAESEIRALRERLADATRPPTLYARMHLREAAVSRFARLRLAVPPRSRFASARSRAPDGSTSWSRRSG